MHLLERYSWCLMRASLARAICSDEEAFGVCRQDGRNDENIFRLDCMANLGNSLYAAYFWKCIDFLYCYYVRELVIAFIVCPTCRLMFTEYHSKVVAITLGLFNDVCS